VTAVRTLPMMSPRRVVIVLQAQGLLVPKRESESAARALEDLEDLLEHPDAQTTLVLVAGTLDKRSRMYKLLAKHATLVECGVLEGVDDAARWVANRVAAADMKIEPAGARLLADRCGTDVKRLRNDVDRLLLYALGQKTISVDDVREIVGPASLQDDWAMANAIEAGDGRTALRQLALMLDAGAAPEQIMGQLGWLVRTKFPFQVPGMLRPAVQALFRTDLDLKRSAGEPRVLLERLVVELCARGAGRPTQGGGARRY
jgi:DNA polymerase III subunit delta